MMQQLHFGKIELTVQAGEPSFTPAPTITKEIKLGIDAAKQPVPTNDDFALKRSVTDLFAHLERLGNGSVVAIEVRHGLPARLIVTRAA
jgi:hypothetical protein